MTLFGTFVFLCVSLSVFTISVITTKVLVRSPESEVVSEQLHDEGRVLVGFLAQGVELSDGVIESLLGQVAGSVGGREDFVVEDGEVEGETQSDGVGGRQVLVGDGRSGGVSVQSGGSGSLSRVADLELGQVSVVVALHLVVEDLAFFGGGVGDEFLLEDLEDISADVEQFLLDLLSVLSDNRDSVALALLLDGRDHSPRSSSGADHVLVSDRKQVPFLNSELLRRRSHRLHVLNHLIKPKKRQKERKRKKDEKKR